MPPRITHSLFEGDALLSQLRDRYELGVTARCELWHAGDSDMYLVTERGSAWIARLYQHTKATVDSVEAETRVLGVLSGRGLPVPSVTLTNSGQPSITILAPEGPRQLVLTPRVSGVQPGSNLTVAQAASYGQVVAQLHNALDDMRTDAKLPMLDIVSLVEKPVSQLTRALVDSPRLTDYVTRLATQLTAKLNLPRSGPSWGVCHADLHKSNVLFDEAGRPTVIDWECCAESWRAYELAVMRWSIGPAVGTDGLGAAQTSALWAAYFDSYTSLRPLSDIECSSIPLFVAARHLWVLGVNLQHVTDGHWGKSYVFDYLPESLELLQQWVTTNCPDLDP